MLTLPTGPNAFLTFTVALLVGIGIGIIGFALGRILAPTRELPKKKERYECGNPPKGRARGIFTMQYYPYLIIFLTVEPVAIYGFLVALAAHHYTLRVAGLLGGMILLLAPSLVFGLKWAGRLEVWSVE